MRIKEHCEYCGLDGNGNYTICSKRGDTCFCLWRCTADNAFYNTEAYRLCRTRNEIGVLSMDIFNNCEHLKPSENKMQKYCKLDGGLCPYIFWDTVAQKHRSTPNFKSCRKLGDKPARTANIVRNVVEEPGDYEINEKQKKKNKE